MWRSLTETKLTNDKHTLFRNGYSVCASRARSSSQGGVALIFNRSDPRFDMTLFCCWGPDVVSIRIPGLGVVHKVEWR